VAGQKELLVGESLLFDFDFSRRKEIVGGTVELSGTPVVTATPSGLTIGTPVVGGDNKIVQVRIGSATPGTYCVKCLAPTDDENVTLGEVGELVVKDC